VRENGGGHHRELKCQKGVVLTQGTQCEKVAGVGPQQLAEKDRRRKRARRKRAKRETGVRDALLTREAVTWGLKTMSREG